MNLTEDRLRAALSETAGEIPADSVPPLDLLADTTSASSHPDSWSRAKRLRRWPAAIAAVAAVCLIVGLSVAVSDGGQAQRPAANYSYLLKRVPQYYMSLLSPNDRTEPEEAVVHDTVTGAVVATIRPPSPFVTFDMMAAAPDDRTFVLAARPGHSNALLPSQIYLARLDPASRSIRLTRAPIPEFPANEDLQSLAVSPDGKELAVGLALYGPDGHSGRVQVRIYSLGGSRAVKPVREWTGKYVYADLGSMSWVRTGIAFIAQGQGVSVLDTHARSDSLQHASRLVWRMWSRSRPATPGRPVSVNVMPFRNSGALTDDGTTIVTVKPPIGTAKATSHGTVTTYSYRPGFEKFSVATGKLLRIIGPDWPTESSLPPITGIVWTNSSGSALVVEAPPVVGKPSQQTVLGVVSGNKFEPIPGAPPVISGGYITQFAF